MDNQQTRAVIWVSGTDISLLSDAINILSRELKGLYWVGVSGDQKNSVQCNGHTLPFIPIDEILKESCDYIILSGGAYNYPSIAKRLAIEGINENNLLPDKVICIPGFTVANYQHLRQSRLSIFSLNCFGGLISHLFCLPFRSPFVNLFCNEEQFVDMLDNDPRIGLSKRLVLKGTAYEQNLQFDYPIYDLNGLILNMNHYPDYEIAEKKWTERLQRVNWYNLLCLWHNEIGQSCK
jgi:hypothetical protein